MPVIDIAPIWGNGWTDGDKALEPPAPFSVDAQRVGADGWSGMIVTPGHQFEGRSAQFAPRFTNFLQGAVAITVTGHDGTPEVFGDGRIDMRWVPT